MKKTLTALAAVAVLAGSSLAMSSPAAAHCRGCGFGAGLLGGLFAGAIIGGAVASGPYYYGPGPVYAGPGPGPGPGCYHTRQPVWDPATGAYRPGPRVLVCP